MESINLASHEGIQQYLKNASSEELKDLASKLRVDLDNLPGAGTDDKVREMIAYLDRRRQLPELILLVMRSYVERQLRDQQKPSGSSRQMEIPLSMSNEVSALNLQLTSLREQVDELRRPAGTQNIEAKLDELERTADAASRITADVVLPPPEAMAVRLVPVHQLQRLEEYHSDENIAYLLVGASVGAMLSLLSNWVMSNPFAPTSVSVVLMVILGVLTSAGILWVSRLKKRADSIAKEVFQSPPHLGKAERAKETI